MWNESTGVRCRNKALFEIWKWGKRKQSIIILRGIKIRNKKWNNKKMFSIMSNLQTNYQVILDLKNVEQHTRGKWLIHGTKRHNTRTISCKAWTPRSPGYARKPRIWSVLLSQNSAKIRKSTDHDHNLISSECGQDTSAYEFSGHALHAFSGKCPTTPNLLWKC